MVLYSVGGLQYADLLYMEGHVWLYEETTKLQEQHSVPLL